MKSQYWKFGVVAILAVALAAVLINKHTLTQQGAQASTVQAQPLPRLLDLGSRKCIPCKMMTPVLDQLSREYRGKLAVEFVDVNQNPGAADKYRIQSIPTQIFFDIKGREFYRHEGFFPKEDILAKFREKGITF